MLAGLHKKEQNKILNTYQGQKTFILSSALLTAVITFLVYIPSLQNDFVNWDDDEYILEELNIRSIDLNLLKKIFTTVFLSNWHPLTTFSYALDYSVWGLNPWGYHLINIVFHALNTFLVFILAVRLIEAGKSGKALIKDSKPYELNIFELTAGFIASLLFGLHPLHVESVAWVSERKDVLSCFFFLLSVLAYIRYTGPLSSGKLLCYLSTLFFFILALLSKPMAITLPVVLLILDYYPLERISDNLKKAISEKVPFFILGAASALLTIWAQKEGQAIGSLEEYPFIVRISVALRSFIFYLYKMVLPLHLAPIYPYPTGSELYSLTSAAAIALFIAVSVFSVLMLKRRKIFPAVWFYYVITLLPVIGIVQVGRQAAADRYTYLPSLGIFIMAGAGAGYFLKMHNKKQTIAVSAISSVFIFAALSAMTVNQIRVWKDSITLWSREIQEYPDKVFLAYHQRGLAYEKLGDHVRALEDYNKAIAIGPRYAYMYNNRGLVHEKLGNYKEAIADLDKAISLTPGNSKVYDNRGSVYLKLGDYQKAIEDFNSAISLNPKDAKSYTNRGFAYEESGDIKKALEDYNKAIVLDPGYAYSYNNRGFVYGKLGNFRQAIEDYNKAIALDPGFASPYNNRGLALHELGDNARAIEDFSAALKLDPKFTNVYVNRGIVYSELGRYDQAIADFNKAAVLDPRNTYILLERGFAYLKKGDYKEAALDYEAVIRSNPENASAFYGLGLSDLKLGDPGKASIYLKKASRLGSKEAEEFLKANP